VNKGDFIVVEGADKIWDFKVQDVTYARKNDKIGFINLEGKWIIEAKFDKAKAFVKNLAPVFSGGKWGYINSKGDYVITPKYDDAEIFSKDGLAPVKDSKWGFINETGILIIPTQYEISAIGFSFFSKNDKGFINGLARVKSNKDWGFLKPDGQLLGNQWFENAEPFQD